MWKIIIKSCFVITSALVLSFGLDSLYREKYDIPYELPKNLFIHPEISDKYEIIKLGNSHADDGIIFDKYQLKSLKLSSVAQSFEYDLASLKMYSRQIKDGAVIVINVSPLSFSQRKASKEDSLQYQYYDGRISPFLIPNLKIEDYLQTQILPFLRTGFVWREKYAEEMKNKSMESYAQNSEPLKPSPTPEPVRNEPIRPTTNQPKKQERTEPIINRAEPIFHAAQIKRELAAPDTESDRLNTSADLTVNKWHHTDDFKPEYFATNQQDLEKLIRYCLSNKWRPVLITIPISQTLLDKLEPNYMRTYLYDNIKKANIQGVRYFDFSQNTDITRKEYFFSNSDHLSPRGASIFSYLLLQELIKEGYISSAADGYEYTTQN